MGVTTPTLIPLRTSKRARLDILSVTGLEANTLVLGYDVFRQLKNHPDLVDRIKYTSSQTITEDMLARMFDIERVLVSKSIKATNAEGATAGLLVHHGQDCAARARCPESRHPHPVRWLHVLVDWCVAGHGPDDWYVLVPS
jgi:hypothetical protein